MKPYFSPFEVKSARYAGLLYLIIIVCGISAEMVLRGPLVDLSNAGGTAAAILADIGTYRMSIAADLVMAVADAGLAVLLFILFRPFAPHLALAAMIFRLVQSVLIAANLMNMQGALLLLTGVQDLSGLAPEQAETLALFLLNLHAHGYDLGLVFFGINSLMTGALIWHSALVNKSIGLGLALAGAVYLTGSSLRFFAPGLFEAFSPAYLLTIIAEGAFCISLLLFGLRRQNVQPA